MKSERQFGLEIGSLSLSICLPAAYNSFCSSNFSYSVTNSAQRAWMIMPSPPLISFRVMPARMSRMMMVTTKAINVIPILFFHLFSSLVLVICQLLYIHILTFYFLFCQHRFYLLLQLNHCFSVFIIQLLSCTVKVYYCFVILLQKWSEKKIFQRKTSEILGISQNFSRKILSFFQPL